MSGLANLFGFLGGSSPHDELPNLFPLPIADTEFIKIDVTNVYIKILTDVVERSDGISDDLQAVFWDNCLAGDTSHGLVHKLARAMYEKAEIFLVYDKATKVLRKATGGEEATIRADYQKQAESKVGVYISFAKYHRTDMVRLYSMLEYLTVAALNKSMNISKAVQFKIDGLRANVGLVDASVAKAQAQSIANALKKGNDVLMDGKDIVDTVKPDLTATNASMEFLNGKKAGYLNMPCSYIDGELNGGLGDSGQADARAIERGLKSYFVSIMKPVCKALFGIDIDFKSEDYDQIEAALDTIKTFELMSEELMTKDNQRQIVNKLFGLDPDTEGGPPADPVIPNPGIQIGQNKPANDPKGA